MLTKTGSQREGNNQAGVYGAALKVHPRFARGTVEAATQVLGGSGQKYCCVHIWYFCSVVNERNLMREIVYLDVKFVPHKNIQPFFVCEVFFQTTHK